MKVIDWGLVEYETSTSRQLAMVDSVAAHKEPEALVFCSHPPVVTLGRAWSQADLVGWSGATVETTRGGRATYHGPNQIVIYPILDLREPRRAFAARDIHAYLRALEGAVVTSLRELGLPQAEARTTPMGEISLTGVWVGPKKIASIGIAVRRWTTYHGVAINIENDAKAFLGIKPCGFAADIMTSVAAELGQTLSRQQVQPVFEAVFASTFAR